MDLWEFIKNRSFWPYVILLDHWFWQLHQMSLNFEHFILYLFGPNFGFMQLFPKISSGMACVDPDQTAPSAAAVWSRSTLFAYDILSDTLVYWILRHLP